MRDDDDYPFGFAGPALRPGGRPSATLIVPGLVVGEYPRPTDAEWLRDTWRVTAVVSLQDDGDLAAKALRLVELEAAYRAHNLAFHRIPIPDGHVDALAARLGHLVALVGGLVDAGGCVYLHCNAGFNRAPTVAIAVVAARHSLALDAARDLVKRQRHCVPYMNVLEAYFGEVKP